MDTLSTERIIVRKALLGGSYNWIKISSKTPIREFASYYTNTALQNIVWDSFATYSEIPMSVLSHEYYVFYIGVTYYIPYQGKPLHGVSRNSFDKSVRKRFLNSLTTINRPCRLIREFRWQQIKWFGTILVCSCILLFRGSLIDSHKSSWWEASSTKILFLLSLRW